MWLYTGHPERAFDSGPPVLPQACLCVIGECSSSETCFFALICLHGERLKVVRDRASCRTLRK